MANNDSKSSSSSTSSSDNNNNNNNNLIPLQLTEQLQKEGIVSSLVINTKANWIVAELNHVYDKKKIVSNIYKDWLNTVDTFSDRAKKKKIQDRHISMITDTLDENSEIIMDYLLERQENEDGDNSVGALDLIRNKIVEVFLDEVKRPYAAITNNNNNDGSHIETIPIESTTFEDLVGSEYYYQQKAVGKKNASVLSKETIAKIQSIMRFETNKSAAVKALHLRIAAFVDTECSDLDSNVIYYDLCNPYWEIIKITRKMWNIEKQNSPETILFKRYPIMNAQVYPQKDYPADILDQFLKLTNVYHDEDNKLLASVYLISLFLLTGLPEPMMLPHGTHGSAKSTFQEFIKQVVDPSAAPTTAFPKNLEELVQALSHSYITFFDNVSEIKDLTSDQLCRAVTGSGFVKRGLYTNDEDYIYNMKRAVGYNGINVAATRADLLDRILSLHLKPIDKRQRRKLSVLYKEFNTILPQLLGYIFDTLVQILNRIGEVKLQELPRMADFAEMGELIARCLGYPENAFTDAYNRNIGFTNEEAVEANPVATAIRIFMTSRGMWKGSAEQLRLELQDMINVKKELSGMLYSKGWPRSPHALSDRLNEVTPNLNETGIVVHREYNTDRKANDIIMVNNDPAPVEEEDEDKKNKNEGERG